MKRVLLAIGLCALSMFILPLTTPEPAYAACTLACQRECRASCDDDPTYCVEICRCACGCYCP